MSKNYSHLNRFILTDLTEVTSAEQVFQITKVLRLSENSQLVGIKDGREYLLQLKSVSKKIIFLEVLEELPYDPKRELPFCLKIYLPLLKGEKLDWVLQKCTELGAHKFQFVSFEHSVKHNSNFEHKRERWQKIIIEAVEQSERLQVPQILPPIKVEQITLEEAELAFAFIERTSENAGQLRNLQRNKVSLIFGPEGGFSEAEKDTLALKGFQQVSLGSRILRSETAIIAGTALVCF